MSLKYSVGKTNCLTEIPQDINLELDPLNATVVGTPTISEGVVSGFSDSNYLTLPDTLNVSNGQTWEKVFKFTTGGDVTTQQSVIGCYGDAKGSIVQIQNSLLKLYVSSGSSWDIASAVYGTYTVLPNTTYWLKLEFTGSSYIVYYSLDGFEFTPDITVSSTKYMSADVMRFGETYASGQYFKGSIDLTQSYIKINGQDWWKGGTGILTLKKGSKVYVPNGFKADGITKKFDEVVIKNDLSIAFSNPNNYDPIFVCLKSDGTALDLFKVGTSCLSGTSPVTYSFYYRTDLNKLYDYEGDTNNPYAQLSFPLGLFKWEGSKFITEVYQIFNGFGYIGSTVFVLPDNKCLIPDGYNEDGTYKNIEFVTPEVQIFEIPSSANGDMRFVMTPEDKRNINLHIVPEHTYTSSKLEPSTKRWYNEINNKFYIKNEANEWIEDPQCKIASVSVNNGVVASFVNSNIDSYSLKNINSIKYGIGKTKGITSFAENVLIEEDPLNLNIVGSPTIVNGVASGFNSTNWLVLPENFSPNANSWEMVIKFNLTALGVIRCLFNSSSVAYQPIEITVTAENKLYSGAYVNNTSTLLFGITGTTTLDANKDYYTKVSYNPETGYELSLSTDGVTYTLESSSTVTTPITSGYNIAIGADFQADGKYYASAFTDGSIDISKSYIKINDEIWWKGGTGNITLKKNSQTWIPSEYGSYGHYGFIGGLKITDGVSEPITETKYLVLDIPENENITLSDKITFDIKFTLGEWSDASYSSCGILSGKNFPTIQMYNGKANLGGDGNYGAYKYSLGEEVIWKIEFENGVVNIYRFDTKLNEYTFDYKFNYSTPISGTINFGYQSSTRYLKNGTIDLASLEVRKNNRLFINGRLDNSKYNINEKIYNDETLSEVFVSADEAFLIYDSAFPSGLKVINKDKLTYDSARNIIYVDGVKTKYSVPLGIIKKGNQIKELFQYCGYFGNNVFILPKIKGLTPNGWNTNFESKTDEIGINDFYLISRDWDAPYPQDIWYDDTTESVWFWNESCYNNTMKTDNTYSWWYVPSENKLYINRGGISYTDKSQFEPIKGVKLCTVGGGSGSSVTSITPENLAKNETANISSIQYCVGKTNCIIEEPTNFKYEDNSINVETIGNLYFDKGIFGNFNEQTYVHTKKTLPENPDNFEFVVCFKTSDVTETVDICGSQTSETTNVVPEFRIVKSKLYVYQDYIGKELQSKDELVNDTWYWAKLSYNNNEYKLELSTDGLTYELEDTINSENKMTGGSNISFGFGYSNTIALPFTYGFVDISKSYIKINDELWWKGGNGTIVFKKYSKFYEPHGYDTNTQIYGTPTINDGIVNNFVTRTSYLLTPDKIDFNSASRWEITLRLKHKAENTNTGMSATLKRFSGINAYHNQGNVLGLELSSNGTSFDIGAMVGTTILPDNEWYWAKYEFTGSEYNIWYSDDGQNWNLENTIVSSLHVAANTYYVIGCDDNAQGTEGGVPTTDLTFDLDCCDIWASTDDDYHWNGYRGYGLKYTEETEITTDKEITDNSGEDILVFAGSNFYISPKSIFCASTTKPQEGIYYNKESNTINMYNNSEMGDIIGLPVMLCSTSKYGIKEIKEVYQTYGYINNCYFFVPGYKFSFADGWNENKLYNSIEKKLDDALVDYYSYVANNQQVMVDYIELNEDINYITSTRNGKYFVQDTMPTAEIWSYWYNTAENKMYRTLDTTTWMETKSTMIINEATTDNSYNIQTFKRVPIKTTNDVVEMFSNN